MSVPVGIELEQQVKEKCGNQIVKVILERILLLSPGQTAGKSQETSLPLKTSSKLQVKSLWDAGKSSESVPGRTRPQRNKTKIYTHFFARGNDCSVEDDTGCEVSCSDSEPEDTSDFELESLVQHEARSKTKTSIKTSSIAELENKIHQTNDHSAKTRKLKIGKSNAKSCIFQCDLCPRKFTTQRRLENHILLFHVVDKPFECGVCFKSFLTKKLLQKHVKRVHENNNFNCRFCRTKWIQDSASLAKHIETVHKNYREPCGSESSGINYLCPVCDTWFSTDTDLAEHLKKPNKSKSVMKCELCSETVHTPCLLNLHRQKMHSKKLKANASRKRNHLKDTVESPAARQGPYLEKVTRIPSSAKNSVAMSTKKFSCVVCSAFFSRRCDLDFHELQEKHHRWKCPICAKFVTSKPQLRNHIQAFHSDARPFKCTHKGCGQSFKVLHNLKNHMFMHDPNRVHCNECYKYIPKKSFKMHITNCHTGDEAFKCRVCSKTWGSAKQLKQHLLIHTDERPFPCKFCDSKYKCSKEANRHMKKCQFLSEDQRHTSAQLSRERLQQAKTRKPRIYISRWRKLTDQTVNLEETAQATQISLNELSFAATSLNGNEAELKLVKQETGKVAPISTSELPPGTLLKDEMDLKYFIDNSSELVDQSPPAPELSVIKLEVISKQEIM